MGIHGQCVTSGRIFRFATLLIFPAIIASCASGGEATSGAAEAGITVESAGSEPSEEETAPIGKLLDPCALILPSETEALVGQPIISNYRKSSWETYDFSYIFSNAGIEDAVIGVYGCDTRAGFGNDGTRINVWVLKDAETAEAVLGEYIMSNNNWIAEFGLEMVEIDGIGDRAFRPTVPPTETDVPDLEFISGNYLVGINLDPPQKYSFQTILEFGNTVLSRLPADVHSVLADENLNVDTNQPAGKAVEPCAMITLDEARSFLQEIIDGPIVSETSESLWGIGDYDNYLCRYFGLNTSGGGLGLPGVDIWVWRYASLDYYYSLIAGTELREVDGIGDQAFTNSPILDSAELTVVSGNFVIDIDFHDVSASPALQDAQAHDMAELILSRLPH